MRSRVDRASLQRQVSDSVMDVRQAFVDLGKEIQTVVESSNRLSKDVADIIVMKMGQAWKRMLCFFNVEYINAVGKIRAVAIRDSDDVLWDVVRCTVEISTLHDKIGGSLPVSSESDTASPGSTGPVETSEEAPMDFGVRL